MIRFICILVFLTTGIESYSQSDSCDCNQISGDIYNLGVLDTAYFRQYFRKGGTIPYTGTCTLYGWYGEATGKLLEKQLFKNGYIVHLWKWTADHRLFCEMDGNRHDSILYMQENEGNGIQIYYKKNSRIYMQEDNKARSEITTFSFYKPTDSIAKTWTNRNKLKLVEGCYANTCIRSGPYRKYSGKIVTVTGQYLNNKKEGAWNYYYAVNGKQMFWKNENYIHDLFNGNYVEYYANGQKKAEGEYAHQQKEGSWREWYENGNLKSKAKYKGLTTYDGAREEYYENGKPQKRYYYTHGKPMGVQHEWYDNGQIAMEENFSANGLKTGKQTEWYADGKLKSEVTYSNGVAISPHIEYYDNGVVKSKLTRVDSPRDSIEETAYYESSVLKYDEHKVNGKRWGLFQSYYPSGKPDTIAHYLYHAIIYQGKGDLSDCNTFYPTGILKSAEHFATDLYGRNPKDGECAYYYPSGKPERIENYDYTQRDGECKFFSTDSVLLADLNFKKGNYNGLCRWYFPNGKIWREIRYTPSYYGYLDNDEFDFAKSLRDGPCKEWNAQGKLIYDQQFILGKPQTKIIVPQKDYGNDSIKRLYDADAQILAAMYLNSLTDYDKSRDKVHLFATDTLISKINGDLLAIYNAIPPEMDSAKLIHFDRKRYRTHVYLDYVPYPYFRRDIDTSTGHWDRHSQWPPALDSIIKAMHFVPVYDECAGDDRGGIRRGFTTYMQFNGYVLDSLMKKINPRFGCEYLVASMYAFNGRDDNNTHIICSLSARGDDYIFYYYYSNSTKYGGIYKRYAFRVYSDGSVDMDYDKNPNLFVPYIPE